MKYTEILEGIFKARPNRFIAHVEINGKMEVCHVKNTGRCKELLIEGVKVFLEKNDNPNRKTKYSLIGVQKGNLLINMDSQAPNKVIKDWLQSGNLFSKEAKIFPEKTFQKSRFDFYVEDKQNKIFIEVKGVTLEQEGLGLFPDAPTQRGVKHIRELCESLQQGYQAYIIFVIQMKGVYSFQPNYTTHPEFGETLVKAEKAGVKILAYDCTVTKDSLEIDQSVPVNLKENNIENIKEI